jgi:hypothetical protein
MSKFRSLADFLGNPEADPSEHPELEAAQQLRAEPEAREAEEAFYLESLSGREFADAILSSRIFRRYIIDGMRAGEIPASVVTRFFDYATNWGKPPDRVEHTGKDGAPIETVTTVRRVVVYPEGVPDYEGSDPRGPHPSNSDKYHTH